MCVYLFIYILFIVIFPIFSNTVTLTLQPNHELTPTFYLFYRNYSWQAICHCCICWKSIRLLFCVKQCSRKVFSLVFVSLFLLLIAEKKTKKKHITVQCWIFAQCCCFIKNIKQFSTDICLVKLPYLLIKQKTFKVETQKDGNLLILNIKQSGVFVFVDFYLF